MSAIPATKAGKNSPQRCLDISEEQKKRAEKTIFDMGEINIRGHRT
jgi:hypothetical protein